MQKDDAEVKIPEPLVFKFKLGQTVWYLHDNRVHNTTLSSRMMVENSHKNWASTDTQKESWTPFGKTCIVYASCHGHWKENQIFASKEELLASL